MIVQVSVCPALMVPVAENDPGEVCMQLPAKVISKLLRVSVTMKEPGLNVTD